MNTNLNRTIIAVQLVMVALFVAASIWMLGMSLKTWNYYSRFQSSYMPSSLVPTEMTPGAVKVILSVVVVSIVMVVLGARQAVMDRAIFYNSYWDVFGGLVIFIIPWAVLRTYNSSHHLTGFAMDLGTIAGQAQFGMYWAMTLVVSIIYNGMQVIRHNSVDFKYSDGLIASIFVFVGRIVIGYIGPVFFILMAIPASKNKDESYADFQLRRTIYAAERLAMTGAAIFFLHKLVNGPHMRYIKRLDNELKAALDESKPYKPRGV